jgi:RNA polymerase sigma-70 factor, ECF subfamily
VAMLHLDDPPSCPPAQPELEREWVERTRAGDADAFAAMFHAYYDRLCGFAERYVRSADQAEELVEEVFVRLWQQREECRGCSSLKSYLYTAVRNRALKLLRHEGVVRRTVEQALRENRPLGVAAPFAAADEEVHAHELALAARRAIDRLPARSREAYLLHRQEGLSYAEIAERMGISTKTVENHLIRAVKALREQLSHWTA